MALLSLKNISLSFGGHPLLDNVELHIERGDRACLLGVNGTGKSSMLKILTGEIKPDSGQVVRSSGLRVASLPQLVPTDLEGMIIDIVKDEAGADHRTHEVEQILSRLHLDPYADFSTLSGGTRRRVLLAQALLGQPDLVLLDEPTNHLDLDSIDHLEAYLIRYCRTFLFVTHDRSFLRRLATRIVELDRGRLLDWRCDYDTFLIRKEESLHAESREWKRMDEKLEKEEAWRRQGVKARTCRNQGRLKALEALRSERRERRERVGSVNMTIQQSYRTGDIVLKAENVSFGFDKTPIIRDFTTMLTRGDKIGILGPNGCGKTTLIRLLLENASGGTGLTPQTGKIVHGTNLKIAYSDQLRAQLDDNATLAENIASGKEFVEINGGKRHIVGYLSDFLFPPERVRQPVKSLSGGERNRLLLARLFATPSNVLVLDEPTNDLDLDTLELLEEQLANYNGTVLVISHDRTFLNNAVTSVWAFEKHSAEPPYNWIGPDDGWYINDYVGGYDNWEEQRILAPVPPEPEREKTVTSAEKSTAPARKLTYKEKQEQEALPARIEALESEQTQWHVRLADPAFYKQNAAEIAKATKSLDDVTAKLDAAYRRWEELEARV